jgi:hypothetical protein
MVMFQLPPTSHSPVTEEGIFKGKKVCPESWEWQSRAKVILWKSDDDEEAFNNAKNRGNYLEFVPLKEEGQTNEDFV